MKWQDYEEIKNNIYNTLLKDTNINTIKKKAIKQIVDDFYQCCKLAIDTEYPNEQLITFMISIYYSKTKDAIYQVLKFEYLNIIDDLTYYANIDKLCSFCFFKSCFDLYDSLKLFQDSGINESNFHKEITSLNAKKNLLQKFSDTPIILNKTPKHPVDSIRLFITANPKCHHLLAIINLIIAPLHINNQTPYKILPKPSKIQVEWNKRQIQFSEISDKIVRGEYKMEWVEVNKDHLIELFGENNFQRFITFANIAQKLKK